METPSVPLLSVSDSSTDKTNEINTIQLDVHYDSGISDYPPDEVRKIMNKDEYRIQIADPINAIIGKRRRQDCCEALLEIQCCKTSWVELVLGVSSLVGMGSLFVFLEFFLSLSKIGIIFLGVGVGCIGLSIIMGFIETRCCHSCRCCCCCGTIKNKKLQKKVNELNSFYSSRGLSFSLEDYSSRSDKCVLTITQNNTTTTSTSTETQTTGGTPYDSSNDSVEPVYVISQ